MVGYRQYFFLLIYFEKLVLKLEFFSFVAIPIVLWGWTATVDCLLHVFPNVDCALKDKHLHHINEKMEMKYSKNVCAHKKVIVVLNADKDKYLNYETSTNGDLIGNVCISFHDSERLNSFGVLKKFNIADGGYARVIFPEKLVP